MSISDGMLPDPESESTGDSGSDLDIATATLGRSYDTIPYFAYNTSEHARLDHLAVLASLHGLAAPDPASCRVLELACGRGGNLISLARQFPGSRFTGIDLSANHVRYAAEAAASSGAGNATFRQLDLMNVPADFGTFDYIFVFGTFSWVPRPVQDRIFALCRQHLSDDGLAVVHYMVYPAAYRGRALRDIMLYHLEPFEDPDERLEQATDFLGFLARSTANQAQHDYRFMIDALYRATFNDPRNFYHEYLNVSSSGLYFREFVDWAARHELQFMCESGPPYDATVGFPEETEQALSMVPDVSRREQYRDFLTMRSTRQSVLCRAGRRIRRRFEPASIHGLYIAAPVSAREADPESGPDDTETFALREVGAIHTSHPLSKAALRLLADAWPLGFRWHDLRRASLESLGMSAPEEDHENAARAMASTVLRGFRHGLVELRLSPPDCVNEISARPRVSDLARSQVAVPDCKYVTNQRHGNVNPDEMARQILPWLDGTRTHADLEEILLGMAREGTLKITERGEPVPEETRLRRLVHEGIQRTLSSLLRASLLVG